MISVLHKEEFRDKVEEDKENRIPSYCRFPVRFILLENFEDLRDVVENFKDKANIFDITDLEIFAKNHDGWITPNAIINKIKSLTPNSDHLILLLSEIVRFLSDEEFFSFFSGLMSIENLDISYYRRRLYIPLVGITQRFINIFWDKYDRREEFSPVWQILGNKDRYNLFLVSFDFEVNPEEFTLINSSKDFLDLWKKPNINNKLISKSKTLWCFSSKVFSDEFFEITRINNIKEYLSEVLKIKVPFSYKDEDENFWKILLRELENRKLHNLYDFIGEYLNIKRLETENPISLWIKKESDFSHWLIKNYYLSDPNFENAYIREVVSSIRGYDSRDFLENYFFKIFDKKFSSDVFDERRKVLREFYLEKKDMDFKFLENPLEERFGLLTKEEIPKYLTGITFFEKKWIVENLDLVKNLKNVYPELEFYLRDLSFNNLAEENLWLKDYFKEYRISRIKNSPSEKLIEIISNKNINLDTLYKCYHSFEEVDKLIEDEDEKIWIDGLGVEFLPLVVSLLEEKKYYVDFRIAISNPFLNDRFNDFENMERISLLDDFNQSNGYKYPENLIVEIEIVRKVVDKISEFRDRFVIFSNRGFRSFTYEFNKEDLVDSFQEKSAPEEVLIPVIYASKRSWEDIVYKITLLDEVISYRKPILRFKVKPKPKNRISIRCKDRELTVSYDGVNDLYEVDFSKFKPGEYKITIIIGAWEETKIITLKGGFKERDIL